MACFTYRQKKNVIKEKEDVVVKTTLYKKMKKGETIYVKVEDNTYDNIVSGVLYTITVRRK